MKQITLLLGALLLLTALTRCSKKTNDPEAYAYWSVDDDTVAYSNIWVNTAPIRTEIRVVSAPASEDMFSIVFQMGSLPHAGTFRVDYVASEANLCNVYVDYKGITYDVAPEHNLTTVKVSALANGKGRYELEPTWFYKQLDPTDSILVKAVVIEP